MYIDATRIVFVCPIGKGPQYRAALFRAANRIKVELFPNSNGRLTYSADNPTVFSADTWAQGWKWQAENVVIFADVPDQSAFDVHPILMKLSTVINTELAHAGGNQPGQRVWITAHPMYILPS